MAVLIEGTSGHRFEGVLAVLDRPTVDGRTLGPTGAPASESRPLPLPFYGYPGGPVIGSIDRLWIDGTLLRYAGMILPEFGGFADEIRAGRLVGELDAADGRWSGDGSPIGDVTLTDWHVQAATLGQAGQRVWPEMSLTLLGEREG